MYFYNNNDYDDDGGFLYVVFKKRYVFVVLVGFISLMLGIIRLYFFFVFFGK